MQRSSPSSRLQRCGLINLVAMAGLMAQAALAGQSPPQAPLPSAVEPAVRAVMARHHIPGMVIAVSDHGKQSFFSYGVASKETGQPVTPRTLFEIGSISKTFTATLATYAQAQGQLSLTDPISAYLPELAGRPLGQVRLLNLGTHTAGGFPLQVPDDIQNQAQLMDYFRAWAPQYPTGTHRTYANPSIGLLGVIAAKSLQLPFEQAMQQSVFSPLGLTSTYLDVPASEAGRYAQGYNKDDAPVRLAPGMLAAQAYGVKTTAQDLLRFIEANLGQWPQPAGAPLREAVMATHRGYFKSGPFTQDLIWEHYDYPVPLQALLEGNSDRMAYESVPAVEQVPALPAQDNAWFNKTGATGGFGAYVAFIPSKQQAVVILANKNYPNAERVRLAYTILGEPPQR
ncbi:class C beta-lactamase [Pseudomonas sp. RIT-PI-S]|uniref:class C beta-lactamase n=1 Tax=Pseudomonas sp. RIT-PI-S TaxID=3035295 RepID=UPI0021D8E804|nr:class C beta-lactamase [Pseudomonas sp. RIT-PI-S]